MKKIAVLIFLGAAVSAISAVYAKNTDPKVCYERCMEKLDDKKECRYICYNEK